MEPFLRLPRLNEVDGSNGGNLDQKRVLLIIPLWFYSFRTENNLRHYIAFIRTFINHLLVEKLKHNTLLFCFGSRLLMPLPWDMRCQSGWSMIGGWENYRSNKCDIIKTFTRLWRGWHIALKEKNFSQLSGQRQLFAHVTAW